MPLGWRLRCCREPSLHFAAGTVGCLPRWVQSRIRLLIDAVHESASLIGRLGSSAFRPSTKTVSTSLASTCFSSESAPRPFHHGIRGRGGTIFRAALPSAGPSGLANSPHPSSREGHHFHRVVELEFPPVVIGSTSLSCHCGFSGPAELGAVSPDAVHDYGQPSRQRDNRSFHPAPSGNLHRPGLEP